MKKKSILQGIYVVGIIGCLTIAGIYIFVGKTKYFSEQENRYLTTLPEISWKGITDGSVQEQLDKFASDQFPLRNQWMELSTTLEKGMGNSCINGIYLGKDGYYLEQVLNSDISQTRYENNLTMLQQFLFKGNGKKAVMLVPSRGCILKDKLPKGAVMYEDAALYEKGHSMLQHSWIDLRAGMQQAAKENQVYFRTDHHWTLQGAYTAYTVLERQWKGKITPYESFSPTEVSKDFLGTMYAKVLEKNPKKDCLEVPKALPQNLKVTCDGETRQSIYEEEKLQGNDKYAVYFGGNYGIVEMENPQAKGETLFVIKDSFANSFVPLLTENYKKIVMLDLRYYNLSVQKILEENAGADILVLYEMSNFAKEENLHKLLD